MSIGLKIDDLKYFSVNQLMKLIRKDTKNKKAHSNPNPNKTRYVKANANQAKNFSNIF